MRAHLFAILAILSAQSFGCQSIHYSSDRAAPASIVGDSMTIGGTSVAALQPTCDEAPVANGRYCPDCVAPYGPAMGCAAEGCYGGDCLACQTYLPGRMGWGRGSHLANRKQLLDGRVRDGIRNHCANGKCGGAVGPEFGAVTYPYYTTRGPRDFLLADPPGIGP